MDVNVIVVLALFLADRSFLLIDRFPLHAERLFNVDHLLSIARVL